MIYSRKVLGVLLVLALLVPIFIAVAAPANPMTVGSTAAGKVTAVPQGTPSVAPQQTPTAEPQETETAEPQDTQSPDSTAAPAEPDGEVAEEEPAEELTEDELAAELALADIVLEGLDGDPLELIDGVRHILLAGLDARPGQSTGRSDTMIILTLDADNKAIKLTSLMRDMYVEIPGKGGNRINAAWVYGGADLLMKTIKQNFGIEIDEYVAVDFSMLADVIDQIGGLTLTITDKTQMKAINGVIEMDNEVLGLKPRNGFVTETGEQLLTGKQAQAYARYRKYTKDGDFGRTARQREVIIKCIDKLSSLSVIELTQLAAHNIDKVNTNLTLNDVLELLPAAVALRNADVEELRLPADGAYSSKTIKGMSVLVPNLKKSKSLLADFING